MKKNFNTLKRTVSLLISMFFFFSTLAFAQQGITVSGTVTDNGDPLTGVTVRVQGANIGTSTDINGKYQLTVPNGDAVLQFSFIGYTTVVKQVGSLREIDIELTEDSQILDEVVVVGYGTLKKKLVTGATIQVAGESLQKLSTTSPLTALQSQSPGVTIMQDGGQPGSGFTVFIRGLGSNSNSGPLYVIDGVVGGSLTHMSASDIESIDILKDAASSAIYGARAANGVILITTKQGKVGKPVLEYSGYYGQQYMFRKPEMLMAKDYMMLQDELRTNAGQQPYDWERLIGSLWYNRIRSGEWEGSDWVGAWYCPGAPTLSHTFNVTGGNEYSKFSTGYSYLTQDGILGEAVQSNYTRHTFRMNSDHVLLRIKNFDAIKIGQTLLYTYREDHGISSDRGLHNMLREVPIRPIYDDDGTYYDMDDNRRDGWDFENQRGNPIGIAAHNEGLNLSKNHSLRASAYLQIQPIQGLVFKSLFGYSFSASSSRSQTQKMNFNTQANDGYITYESVSQNQSVGFQWTLDNTLTYNIKANSHNITALVGQSLEKQGYGESVGASGRYNIFDLGWDYAWVSNMQPIQLADRGASGSPSGEGSMASFFGRVEYNYDETYLATLIMRADGSSNFARGHRWGYFPSVSAGWIMSNESFMESTKDVLNFLKLRASWGQNGRCSITSFQYVNTFSISSGSGYVYGSDKTTISSGATPGRLRNPDVSWEKSEQWDVGFDSYFLKNRLGVVFSVFNKKTKDWLLTAPISGTWGFSAPSFNGGSVVNKGVELGLSWNDRKGDFTYGMNVNGVYKRNTVLSIENAEGIINGASNPIGASNANGPIQRLQVGHEMGYWYMFKGDGIFQNQAEVDAYVNSEGKPIQPGALPGDVRFVDMNGDGVITNDDKTEVGYSWAPYQLSFGLNFGYKGFDLQVSGAGQFGHLICKSYREVGDYPTQNWTKDIMEKRWTGEGSTNKWPRLTAGGHNNLLHVSDQVFLEKGDYVKILNITLGYNFKKILPQIPFERIRAYVTAQNPFILTNYSGIDPEITYSSGSSWAAGIDRGMYPASRTFLFGLNASF